MKQLRASVLKAALLLCLSVAPASGQSSSSRVFVTIRNPPEVVVSIDLSTATNSWSFRNSYAGTLGLGDRIREFQANGSGTPVPLKNLAPGEFRLASPVNRVSYVINISPGSTAGLPHISWLTNDSGVLMLADTLPDLPEIKRGVVIEFGLPEGWQVYSSISPIGRGFVVNEPDKAVFMIGRDLRLTSKRDNGTELRLVTQGEGKFSNKDALADGLRVLRDYQELTGFKLRFTPTIFIAPLPLSGSNWKAETRGPTSILLLNSQASRKNWRAQLSIIFTHELFHLWVPNSLQLTGDYDWFFEGFTAYIALQEALKLKLIRFQEYLNTLGRVYDSYLSVSDDKSLLEASESRWTSSSSVVYDKAMLVAFIYDLLLRRESVGASSLADRYRMLFARIGDKPADANEVIIQTLTSSPATSEFLKSYIESRNRVELERILPPLGIEVNKTSSQTVLSISKELRDDQKKLLRSLGYRK
jgi:predicted metalloprotease with PDZ domain